MSRDMGVGRGGAAAPPDPPGCTTPKYFSLNFIIDSLNFDICYHIVDELF